MVYDFVVTLKNERLRSIDIISSFLILLSAFAFLSVIFQSGEYSLIFPAAACILVGGIVVNWLRKRKGKAIYFSPLLIVAGIAWLAMPVFPWIGLILLLLSLLEKPARMPLEIGFTQDRVVLNTLFRKKHS